MEEILLKELAKVDTIPTIFIFLYLDFKKVVITSPFKKGLSILIKYR